MGVGPGCYLVLPVLGPSTVRDTTGIFCKMLLVEILGIMLQLQMIIMNIFSDFDYYASKVLSGIDFRAKNMMQ